LETPAHHTGCRQSSHSLVPPSGGSLEIGNVLFIPCKGRGGYGSSPFGGIPRNWKRYSFYTSLVWDKQHVPPSGGSLEIGNYEHESRIIDMLFESSPFGGIPRNWKQVKVKGGTLYALGSSPFGGIPRNWKLEPEDLMPEWAEAVPPSGGSLEIGNQKLAGYGPTWVGRSPFGGIPRNWKQGL